MAQDDQDRPPRPRYGEYATPQEQRAHVREPMPAPVAPARAPVPVDVGPARPAARPRPLGGSVFALILLAYGAVNVALSVPSFLDLAPALTRTYRLLGVPGTFTNTAAAHTWGVTALVVLIVGFLLTAWLTVRRVRRARSAWWVPLVGAAVTYLVIFVCLSVPLMGDPAFIAYVQRAR